MKTIDREAMMMSVQNLLQIDPLPDFLTATPVGSVRVSGTRVGLEVIASYLAAGMSVGAIASHVQAVPLATVHKCIAFILEHESAVAEYLRGVAALAQAHDIPPAPTPEQLRARRVTPADLAASR